jgi:hypothetical protein
LIHREVSGGSGAIQKQLESGVAAALAAAEIPLSFQPTP